MKVLFSPKMVADSGSFSPSASKPEWVVQAWLALDLPLEIVEPDPATREQFALAHDRAFVDGVLDGRIANGFGNRSPAVAASLPYTSGAMLSAARAAIDGARCAAPFAGVAAAPCSGFHHAGYGHAAGFCTFNGLMVAACVVKQEGRAERVGILDFDEHYGDGTDDIVERLGAEWVVHYTAGRHWRSPAQAERFLAQIPAIVETMADCDVVLYQAGADPHVDDPLGGWLTTDQLRRRDRAVFEACRRLGLPVAWNLAGGYQEDRRRIVEIHVNTMRECAEVYGGLRGDKRAAVPSDSPRLGRAFYRRCV